MTASVLKEEPQFLGDFQAQSSQRDVVFENLNTAIDEVVFQERRIAPLSEFRHRERREPAGISLDVVFQVDSNVTVLNHVRIVRKAGWHCRLR
jgi:hypothetical protein